MRRPRPEDPVRAVVAGTAATYQRRGDVLTIGRGYAQRWGGLVDCEVARMSKVTSRTYPEFKARYDAKAAGLAEYLRDAIAAYADQHLS